MSASRAHLGPSVCSGWGAEMCPAVMARELSSEQERMVTEQPLLHKTWER